MSTSLSSNDLEELISKLGRIHSDLRFKVDEKDYAESLQQQVMNASGINYHPQNTNEMTRDELHRLATTLDKLRHDPSYTEDQQTLAYVLYRVVLDVEKM
jgi:hypothetical protein